MVPDASEVDDWLEAVFVVVRSSANIAGGWSSSIRMAIEVGVPGMRLELGSSLTRDGDDLLFDWLATEAWFPLI